jgi:hypothetical protein
MVIYVGCGAECECDDVAQTVGTTVLFRRMHSDDVKPASEKWLLHTTFLLATV